MRIGTLGDGAFLQVGLENSIYKNSECKSQTKKIFGMEIFFFVGAKWFFASFSLGLDKFQIACILNFFFGRRGWGRGAGQLLP